MDGHEREDVVKYQKDVFLPLMAEHERCMVKWAENENGKFEHLEPQLQPGEKSVIPIFQDESSFHAGEYKSNVWWVFSLFRNLCLILTLRKGCTLMNKNL